VKHLPSAFNLNADRLSQHHRSYDFLPQMDEVLESTLQQDRHARAGPHIATRTPSGRKGAMEGYRRRKAIHEPSVRPARATVTFP
jgi:hypothetical protein